MSRAYHIPFKSLQANKVDIPDDIKDKVTVDYSVGQPMGALSS